MKNRVVEIDDNVVALEIIYKGTRLLCYIDKVDLPKAALIRGSKKGEKNIFPLSSELDNKITI